jgi:hypothetical protein
MTKLLLPALAVVGLAACDAPAVEANNAAAGANEVVAPADETASAANDTAAAPNEAAAAQGEKVLGSETVEAVVTGWEMGDYLWATLRVEGSDAEEGAWVGSTPLEHFLEAHKGKRLTLRIDTVRMVIPSAGGEEEIKKIVEASVAGTSAQEWWTSLSAEKKQAAERRMEEVLGGGG